MRSVVRTIHLLVAALLVVGLVAQVFLAGLGVFAGPAAFATHRDFGFLLTAVPILLLVLGLLGRLGRRPNLLAALVFGQFILQSVFVAFRADMPAIAALHPVNAFLMLLVALVILWDSWVLRRSAAPATEA